MEAPDYCKVTVKNPTFPRKLLTHRSVKFYRSSTCALPVLVGDAAKPRRASSLPAMALRNLLTTAGTLAAAWTWTKLITTLHKRHHLTSSASRKVIHFTAAPVMMLTWPLYTPAWHARLLASCVPLLFGVRMHLSRASDDLCLAVSRSGDRRESRGGPGAYCVAVGGLVLAFWRASPTTYAALGMLVAGDGCAGVVGAAVGGPRWPIARSTKTCAGSGAFVVGGACATKLFLRFAEAAGVCTGVVGWGEAVAVACVCAAAELLPVQDNVSVPLSAIAGAELLF